MKALLSGQSGRAMMFAEGSARRLNLDDRTLHECDVAEVWRFLADADDIRSVEVSSHEELADLLEVAWRQDRSLHLILVLLDPGEARDVRLEAAECLDELIAVESVKEFVFNRLYSCPLPEISDIQGAITLAIDNDKTGVAKGLHELLSDQNEIKARHDAWTSLPLQLFGTSEDRARLRSQLIDEGAFRTFVVQRQRRDFALFQLLANPKFRGDARARQILQSWAAPFRSSSGRIDFGTGDEAEWESVEPRRQRRRSGASSHLVFQNVAKQKEGIKGLLRSGHRERALAYINQLVQTQRQSSTPAQIAMSLCDLAQYAKQIGDTALQLQLARRATSEAPDDAWAFGQLGDALRETAQFPAALAAYQRAANLGDRRVALLGHAEVLKDLGQMDQALSIYDQCIAEFPHDPVPRNGHASALAKFGRLVDALAEYNNLVRAFPYEVVTLTGRAQVLRDLGQLDESLSALREIVRHFPDEPIPHTTLAEVLRELGRLEESLEYFGFAKSRFPDELAVHNGYARVLREMGRARDALDEYQRITKEFPGDATAHIGVAETHKRAGELSEALEAYSRIRESFPNSGFVRTGLAAVLTALGRYADALDHLPSRQPATQSEWVAFHVRAIALLRSGDTERAEEMLEWGVTQNPFRLGRAYFATSLAALRLRQRRFREAADQLGGTIPPSLQAPTRLLEMHAFGELGDETRVRIAYEAIPNTESRPIIELREYLKQRYAPQTSQPAGHDEWLFREETTALLLAA